MAVNSDSKQLSSIIQDATKQILRQTEEFMKQAPEISQSDEMTSVMVNGEEVKLDKAAYNELKIENKRIMNQMKSDIKSAVFNLKNEGQNTTK